MIDFSIDEPLVEGDSVVSGEGPSDLSISIVDVTLMGEVIGRGKINKRGTFEVEVKPLIANHRIGVMLDAKAVEEYTESVVQELGKHLGDDSMMLPQIGRIYDTAMVHKEKSQ
jgi:hypothetical protein